MVSPSLFALFPPEEWPPRLSQARDRLQGSLLLSLGADARALLHELRNARTLLRLLDEAAPPTPIPTPDWFEADGGVRVPAYLEAAKTYWAQEVAPLARLKLAFLKETTPIIKAPPPHLMTPLTSSDRSWTCPRPVPVRVPRWRRGSLCPDPGA